MEPLEPTMWGLLILTLSTYDSLKRLNTENEEGLQSRILFQIQTVQTEGELHRFEEEKQALCRDFRCGLRYHRGLLSQAFFLCNRWKL